MPAVLADTSVWVDFLRRGQDGKAARLDRLLQEGQVVTCGPVAAELVAGASSEQKDTVWGRLQGLRWVELDAEGWRQAGIAYGRLRGRGQMVPLTDCVIAVAAMVGEAELWTFDDDFARFAEVLPRLRRYEPQ